MNCMRCGRRLRNPHSIARHYGPVCACKAGIVMSKDHEEKQKAIRSKRREHDASSTTYRQAKRDKQAASNAKLPPSYKNKRKRNKTRVTDQGGPDLTEFL